MDKYVYSENEGKMVLSEVKYMEYRYIWNEMDELYYREDTTELALTLDFVESMVKGKVGDWYEDDKYNYMFIELQKHCERENCCNAFRHITLYELIKLNYYLDRLLVFCENLDPEYLEDLECGDKIFDFYRLVNNLFDRDL